MREASDILVKVDIMYCIVACVTGMYVLLSEIGSEIYIFNFRYLSSRHCIYMSKDVRVLIIKPTRSTNFSNLFLE